MFEQRSTGLLIREARMGRSLSVRELARRAGVSHSTLSRWESGRTSPLLTELSAVLDALSIHGDERSRLLDSLSKPRAMRAKGKGVAHALRPTAADLLKALRMRKGLNRDALAEAVGVGRSTIQQWERADSWPAAPVLARTAELLGATPDEADALAAQALASRQRPRAIHRL